MDARKRAYEDGCPPARFPTGRRHAGKSVKQQLSQGRRAMLILAGVGFILVGVFSLVAGDFMWSWQRFSNDLEGQVSERTEAWEVKRVGAGIGMIVLGAIFAIVGFRT
jgi:hypothetical protein